MFLSKPGASSFPSTILISNNDNIHIYIFYIYEINIYV